jgi:flagellar FliJ protein
MTKQLETLLTIEQNKVQRLADELRQAEHTWQQHKLRLNNVGQYRLEYMKQLMERCKQGIDSATYNHFHAFVSKLDNAAEQLQIAIAQAKALVDQKKQAWRKQQQRVKSIELLIEKKQQQYQVILQRKEQKMFDEIANQAYVRRNF